MARSRWLGPVCLLAAIGGALAAPVTARAADAIPVGAIEILSGPVAAYGQSITAGLKMGFDEINQKGVLGGRKIALTVEDSGGNKEGAISAVRQLIGRDHVVALIGPTLSTEMFAVGPLANQRGIPIIGTSTTAVGITAIGRDVFRTSLPEAVVIPITFARAKARGVKTVAIMSANDDAFSKSSHDAMVAAANANGMTVVADESFGSRDTDFSAQLTKIIALKPNALAVSAMVEPTSGILLAAKTLGLPAKTMLIGGNGANSPKLGEIAGSAADGIMVGSPWSLGKTDPMNTAFVAKFIKLNGHPPDQFAAQAYDTAYILADAIDASGDATPEHIRSALQQVSRTGVTGPFAFDADRSPAKTEGVVVLEMRGDKFQILPP